MPYIDKERENAFIMANMTFERCLNSTSNAILTIDSSLAKALKSNPFSFTPEDLGTVYYVYNAKEVEDFKSGKKYSAALGKINRNNWKKLREKSLVKKTYSDEALDKYLNKLLRECNDKKLNSCGFFIIIENDEFKLKSMNPVKKIKEGGSMIKKNDLVKQKEEIALVEQGYNERQRVRESRDTRAQEAIREAIEERQIKQQEALKRQRSFGEFSSNIKKSLLAEALIAMYEASLPFDIKRNSYNKAIGVGMINKFINESGVDDILTKTKYNSLFLSEMNRLVNNYHKAIIESTKKDDPEFKFDTTYKDKFFEDIKGEDFDEITDTIRMRVSDAVEDFIQGNKNNKMDIEEVISHTKDKIDNADYGTPDDVKEEYANIAKRRIENIKNRKFGVLEAIIQKVSKSAMTNDAIKESFAGNEGFDMDKIVEAGTAIYTFLEMVKTSKLVNVDESYIKSFLENLETITERDDSRFPLLHFNNKEEREEYKKAKLKLKDYVNSHKWSSDKRIDITVKNIIVNSAPINPFVNNNKDEVKRSNTKPLLFITGRNDVREYNMAVRACLADLHTQKFSKNEKINNLLLDSVSGVVQYNNKL